MKKVWFDDSWDEFSVALSDVVKQEENDKLRDVYKRQSVLSTGNFSNDLTEIKIRC